MLNTSNTDDELVMAKQLIEYEYPGGDHLRGGNEKEPDVGFERAGFDKLKDFLPTKKASSSLDQAFSTIKPTAQPITDQIRELSVKRQTAEVAFGLVMKADTGAVLASAGIEANVNIKLTWDFRGE